MNTVIIIAFSFLFIYFVARLISEIDADYKKNNPEQSSSEEENNDSDNPEYSFTKNDNGTYTITENGKPVQWSVFTFKKNNYGKYLYTQTRSVHNEKWASSEEENACGLVITNPIKALVLSQYAEDYDISPSFNTARFYIVLKDDITEKDDITVTDQEAAETIVTILSNKDFIASYLGVKDLHLAVDIELNRVKVGFLFNYWEYMMGYDGSFFVPLDFEQFGELLKEIDENNALESIYNAPLVIGGGGNIEI